MYAGTNIIPLPIPKKPDNRPANIPSNIRGNKISIMDGHYPLSQTSDKLKFFPYMCLILLAKEPSKKYKFVMASNRDEFYSRPTESAHWWKEPQGFLAGKDLEQGGTWMGVSKEGKFAAVTNVREFYEKDYLEKKFLSRGDLVKNFFMSNINIDDYQNSINYKNYLGFNLVLSDFKKINICSSRGKENLRKEEKIIVIGNKSFHSSSDKLNTAKKDFEEVLDSEFTSEDLLKLMQFPEEFYDFDQKILNKNHGSEFSARFIKSLRYGTRSTTVMTLDSNDHLVIKEQLYNARGEKGKIKKFEFKISNARK